jgi:hypothetical protein
MEFSTRIAHAYFFAKHYIISKGYGMEVDWQEKINYEMITEERFLNEISWVILSSGMNEKVVKKIFPIIKSIMFNFESSKKIVSRKKSCLKKALSIFNHKGKIEAIIYIAEYVNKHSFDYVQTVIKREGVNYIKTFPYMGQATSFHLAKNIGIDVAKPDRHLIRISRTLGYNSPEDLCREISEKIQEKISLVDLVLWRYATLDKNYLNNLNWFIARKNEIIY